MTDHKIRPSFNPEGILCAECDLRIWWEHRDYNRKPWEGRWVHAAVDQAGLAASMRRHVETMAKGEYRMKRDWIVRAACADMEPGVFQSDEPDYDEALALQTCVGCPAKAQCLIDALAEEGTADNRHRFGVFGGMTPSERASLDRKGRRAGPVAVNHLSATDHEFRTEWHRQGLTDTEIGRLSGVQATTIQKWREKFGLARNTGHPHASPSAIEERRRMVAEGRSNREIADREGANIDAIRSWRLRQREIEARESRSA